MSQRLNSAVSLPATVLVYAALVSSSHNIYQLMGSCVTSHTTILLYRFRASRPPSSHHISQRLTLNCINIYVHINKYRLYGKTKILSVCRTLFLPFGRLPPPSVQRPCVHRPSVRLPKDKPAGLISLLYRILAFENRRSEVADIIINPCLSIFFRPSNNSRCISTCLEESVSISSAKTCLSFTLFLSVGNNRIVESFCFVAEKIISRLTPVYKHNNNSISLTIQYKAALTNC